MERAADHGSSAPRGDGPPSTPVPLSTADVTAHLACAHLTELERRARAGELERPLAPDPWREALGRRHEAMVDDEIAWRASGEVVTVEPRMGWHEAAEATEAAMRSGAAVVARPRLQLGRWRADADLLARVERSTGLGPWGYEPVVVTIARRAGDDRLLRLAAAADAVGAVQGTDPPGGEVRTADGTVHRPDLGPSHRRLAEGRARLAAAADGPPAATRPDPVPHCRRCGWAPVCVAARRAADDVTTIAGVRPPVAAALREAGVATATALARLDVAVPGIEADRLRRLRRQARLQLAQRADGEVRYELLEPAPGRGLARLPPPSPADVFFDIEGSPWAADGGREYLLGLLEVAGAAPVYRPVWAHSRAEERRALQAVVDHLIARWRAQPDMHVYHYAPYEPTALRTLARRHRTRRRQVEALIAGGVFVDLYEVVKGSVLVSQDGYGLKKLEPLYRGGRAGAVADGPASVIAYERWRATGDPAILADLAAYNEVDCQSTMGLRDWLEDRRSEAGAAAGAPLPRPSAPTRPPGRLTMLRWRVGRVAAWLATSSRS